MSRGGCIARRSGTWLLALMMAVSAWAPFGAARAEPAEGPSMETARAPSAAVANAPTAAGAPIYWGTFVKGFPGGTGPIDTFEGAAGKRVSILHWGQAWARNGQYQDFRTRDYQVIRDRGSIPMIDWASWDQSGDVNQPNFKFSEIVQGSHDDYIARWARAARDWGQPFFLRFNPEMNGWWNTWSEQLNGNNPGEFVQAWRHVVDIFRSQGASNATWVWCPNISSSRSTDMAALYPGDSYVDWTCLDGYNWGKDQNTRWLSFGQVFGANPANSNRDSYNEVLRIAPDKPLMIGETSSTEDGGSKADWITDALLTALPQNFPRVQALVWFDWNAGNPDLEWSLSSSPEARAAFANAIASNYYAANNFGQLNLSPIPPLNAVAGVTTNHTALAPVADSYTNTKSPKTNYGSAKELLIDTTERSYLLFDLGSLGGATLSEARLRFKTSTESWAGSDASVTIKLVPDTAWKEGLITYANRVSPSGAVVGTIGSTSPNQWYEISLDPKVVQSSAGNMLSLALEASRSDLMVIQSRESANPPSLVITYQTPTLAPTTVQPTPSPAPDPRYFDATGFRIDDDRIWSYFSVRGGVDVFGLPASRTFQFLGCRTQMFQRQVAQVCDDGQPRLLNLLDPDIFPYTQVNGSQLPAVDEDMKVRTPTPDVADYGSTMLDFVRSSVPDDADGRHVNFAGTYFGLITADVAHESNPDLLGLINLEVWGAPISPPTVDPTNNNFVYQRFQRGVMHYDATTGLTRGLLLGDYLKAVITGRDLPDDLRAEAAGGRLFGQYCPDAPGWVCRPDQLPASDLTQAFERA